MEIELIKEMLFKRVLYTEKHSVIDADKNTETVYSSKIFLSMFNESARRVEPEIIVITDEYVYSLDADKCLSDEYNLVKIYSGALEETNDDGERVSKIYLENSSVDDLRLPTLKAELHLREQTDDELSWREVYSAADNPGASPELIDKLNAEERISRIYRDAEGCAVLEYFGGCLCVEPYRADSGVKPYYYRFVASESSKY